MPKSVALTASALRVAARTPLTWPTFVIYLTVFGTAVRLVVSDSSLPVMTALVLSLLAQVLVLHVMIANVRFLGHAYGEAFMQLRDTQQELRALRASSSALIQQEHRSLAARVQRELGPNLANLAALCEAGSDIETQGLLADLQDAIDENVRPLSHSLMGGEFTVPRPAATVARPRILGFPRSLNLHDVFRPEFLVLLPLPLRLTTQFGQYRTLGLLQGLSSTAVEYVVMVLALRLVPRRPVRRSLALAFVALVPALASIPGALLIQGLVREDLLQGAGFGLYIRDLGLMSVLSVALAYVFSIAGDYFSLRESLAVVQRELTEEVVRQSQQIWAARQQWAYHIHGTVQGLLTAAILQLRQPNVDWPQVREQIRTARYSLLAAPVMHLELETVLASVRDAWLGTCDVRYHFDPALASHVDDEANSLFALNEVLKEGVSNAIRHAGSTSIDVTLVLAGACLDVEIRGDIRASGGNHRPGLGTELFDHVALEWSLHDNVLHLLLPLG